MRLRLYAAVAGAATLAIMFGLGPLRSVSVQAENGTGPTAVELVAAIRDLSAADAARLVESAEPAAASTALAQSDVAQAAAVMTEVFADALTEIVRVMPEGDLAPRLQLLPPRKMWDVPFSLLASKLPNAPVMHLDFWVPPTVPATLPPLEVELSTDESAVYNIPEGREGKWANMVGSPAPFDRLWGHFHRARANVKVNVQRLAQKPSAAPDFPTGRTVNSIFSVNMENMEPGDISVAASVVFVEKDWLETNRIQRWSLEFNRFDESAGTWTPFPTKQVREDKDRVFFAVVIPGFSTFAITGSTKLPEQSFHVSRLSIVPDEAGDGEPVTITALVTNEGPETAVYPANLWIDHKVEAAQTLRLEPGESQTVSFTVAKPPGIYKVRLERMVDWYIVGGQSAGNDAVLPPVGGWSPGPWMALAASFAGAVLVFGGAYAFFHRSSS